MPNVVLPGTGNTGAARGARNHSRLRALVSAEVAGAAARLAVNVGACVGEQHADVTGRRGSRGEMRVAPSGSTNQLIGTFWTLF